jgi:hypothetical protein
MSNEKVPNPDDEVKSVFLLATVMQSGLRPDSVYADLLVCPTHALYRVGDSFGANMLKLADLRYVPISLDLSDPRHGLALARMGWSGNMKDLNLSGAQAVVRVNEHDDITGFDDSGVIGRVASDLRRSSPSENYWQKRWD